MRRRAWLLAMATVLLVPMPGCGSSGVRCDVKSNSPHESKGRPDDIVGKARFGCTATIDSVTAYVEVQELRSGDWVAVAKAEPRTVTGPLGGQKFTTQAVLRCREGTFRTASRGHGYYQGRRSQSTAWDYSPAVKDPCG
jgi:hypothetical protein